MRRVLCLIIAVIVLASVASSTADAQNFFQCSWNSATNTCIVGNETCNEAAGEYADPALCSPLTNQAACNNSGYECIASDDDPPDTTNKYTCEWDGQNGVCIPQVSNNCSPGYQPGSGCANLSPGDCNSSTLISCVVAPKPAPTPVPPPKGSPSELVRQGCPTTHISTGIGCIPYADTDQMAAFVLRWALGIAGGVALLLIGLAGYNISTSHGDPGRLQAGQELMLSAIGGLLMVILSTFLLRFIGIDLLGIF